MSYTPPPVYVATAMLRGEAEAARTTIDRIWTGETLGQAVAGAVEWAYVVLSERDNPPVAFLPSLVWDTREDGDLEITHLEARVPGDDVPEIVVMVTCNRSASMGGTPQTPTRVVVEDFETDTPTVCNVAEAAEALGVSVEDLLYNFEEHGVCSTDTASAWPV